MQDFNAEQWATQHEKLCGQRFGEVARNTNRIFGILAFIGITFVGLSGWSLKAQADALHKQIGNANAQMAAIKQVRADVWTVSRSDDPR